MPADTLHILQTSTDRKELKTSAIILARSTLPADHDQLLRLLRIEEFLTRLDGEADYQAATRQRLRLSRVMEAVSSNSAPSAQHLVVLLMLDPLWLQNAERVEVLLQASTRLRPPAPEVVNFWDKHCQPDDGITPVTVTVLIKNGTEPALRLLERKFADPGHDESEKIAWMHTELLIHRDDLLLLECCERMLKGTLPEKLRPPLIEALFDYKPDEWYLPASISTPPARRLSTPPARVELRKIGDYAVEHLNLTEAQKLSIRKTLEEIAQLH